MFVNITLGIHLQAAAATASYECIVYLKMNVVINVLYGD